MSYIDSEGAVTVVAAPRCPNCGAGVKAGAVECDYCKTQFHLKAPRPLVLNMLSTGDFPHYPGGVTYLTESPWRFE